MTRPVIYLALLAASLASLSAAPAATVDLGQPVALVADASPTPLPNLRPAVARPVAASEIATSPNLSVSARVPVEGALGPILPCGFPDVGDYCWDGTQVRESIPGETLHRLATPTTLTADGSPRSLPRSGEGATA
jgi:hypothetical protein